MPRRPPTIRPGVVLHVLVAGCIAAAVGSPTRAAPAHRSPGATARAQLDAATRLFDSGAYDEARTAIDEGLAADPHDLALLRLKGSLLMALHDLPGALDAYRAYLAAGATGAKKRQVEELIKELLPVTTTSLEIAVANGPAQVYLPAIGKAPFCTAAPGCPRTPVLPRTYQVIAERPGFERWTDRVTVASGQKASLSITLIELPSPLAVRVRLTTARITVDGGPYDPAAKLTAGRHVVELSAPDHQAARREIDAHAGEPIELDLELAPAPPATPPPRAIALLEAPAPPASARGLTGRRVGALVAGGVAGAAAGLGIALALDARQLDRSAYALCTSPSVPCGDAVAADDHNQQARTRALQANVAFGVAGAATIAAGVLWLTGARARAVTLNPVAGQRTGLDVAVNF